MSALHGVWLMGLASQAAYWCGSHVVPFIVAVLTWVTRVIQSCELEGIKGGVSHTIPTGKIGYRPGGGGFGDDLGQVV